MSPQIGDVKPAPAEDFTKEIEGLNRFFKLRQPHSDLEGQKFFESNKRTRRPRSLGGKQK